MSRRGVWLVRPFPAYKGTEPYVFVSYAHGDSAKVYPEIQWLKDQGFNIWYDEGIAPGHEWRQELAEKIERCSLFLYFVTPASVQSGHCVREVNYAIDRQRPLMIVHLAKTQLPSALAMSLSPIQAILAHELSELDYRIKLLRGVSGQVERGMGAVMAPVGTGHSSRKLIITAVAGLLLGLFALLIRAGLDEPEAEPEPEIAPPTAPRLYELLPGEYRTGVRDLFSITPDGTRFIYSTNGRLYTRSTTAPGDTLIAETDDAVMGSWASLDGQWLVFAMANGDHRRVSVNGGMPVTFAKIPYFYGGSWATEDTLIVSSSGSLFRISVMGGEPVRVTTPASGEEPGEEREEHRMPFVLPDGHTVLLAVKRGGTTQVAALDMWRSDPPKIFFPGTTPRYTPTGHLVFYRDDALWAVPFDPEALEVSGSPVEVVRDVGNLGDWGRYSFSNDGTLVYESATGSQSSEIIYVDRQGNETPIGAPPRDYQQVRVAPDGERLAVVIGDPETTGDLWVYSRVDGSLTRLTFDAKGAAQPVWRNAGSTVAFSRRDRDGQAWTGTGRWTGAGIYSRAADGTGSLTTVLYLTRFVLLVPSPDEALLTFCQLFDVTVDCDLALRAEDEESGFRTLLDTETLAYQPVLSPDGRWIAYLSNETGTLHVHVRPFPDIESGHWLVSDEPGGDPFWSNNGTELLYRRLLDNQIVSVPIQTTPIFVAGQPQVLFDASPYAQTPGLQSFDVTPDGQQFVMIKPVAESAARVLLTENFFDELERLVPGKH